MAGTDHFVGYGNCPLLDCYFRTPVWGSISLERDPHAFLLACGRTNFERGRPVSAETSCTIRAFPTLLGPFGRFGPGSSLKDNRMGVTLLEEVSLWSLTRALRKDTWLRICSCKLDVDVVGGRGCGYIHGFNFKFSLNNFGGKRYSSDVVVAASIVAADFVRLFESGKDVEDEIREIVKIRLDAHGIDMENSVNGSNTVKNHRMRFSSFSHISFDVK
nr:40S ribosomal protein S13 [Tanacetum cinerariifolium]